MAHLDQALAQELGSRLLDIVSGNDSNKARLILERQLLEQIYKELTRESKTSYNGLFARIKYIADTLGTPASIQHQVNALRILCNKAAHDELPEVKDQDIQSGAVAIQSLLRWLNPDFTNPDLDSLASSAGFRVFAPLPPAEKQSFTCLVVSWCVTQETPRTLKLELTLCLEDNTELKVVLRDNDKVLYSSLAPSLWKYATLHCENLSAVAGRDNCFIDNPQSVIVLEPDFLLDASSISECIQEAALHPEYYILNRLSDSDNSVKLLIGKMVN
ncbi:MAG TPA: DUF4145 domain-containing protein, partial [Candidatus Cloacimonadota bacterium]|nr:DUF4145 domain-containing protein [Candidatus Cloacimonadota bacterium]